MSSVSTIRRRTISDRSGFPYQYPFPTDMCCHNVISSFSSVLRQNSGTSEITAHKDRVEMKLDVQHFLPEELKVKIVDGMVVVDAKHEEKRDEHGSVSRQFTRKYELPEDVDEDGVVSHLSKEGVLTITAPRKVPQEPERPEKTVPLRVEKEGK